MDLNVWVGEGFVAREPKMTYVGEKQTPKLLFVLGNNRKFGVADKVKTYWIPCSVWGSRAETLMRYLTKGSKVSVVGELRVSNWQDKDGVWQKSFEIFCNQIEFGNSNSKNNTNAKSQAPKVVSQEDDPFAGIDDVEPEENPEKPPVKSSIPVEEDDIDSILEDW